MNTYDFSSLSSLEFELLVRDLLQKKMDLIIENFPEGVDGGVDLRFFDEKEYLYVVQCKRYKSFNDLFKSLKLEVEKVKKIAPYKYLVATSVELSILQKNKIKQLFIPFIHKDNDILGRSDLNNLISLYPEIETRHFKLWMSSINVLNKIINSKVYYQSKYELDELNESLKLYVINESFFDAINILKSNNFITIVGIPGVGKTTLAKMLIYYHLSKGYDELIYISDTIDTAWSVLNETKKQIFYFDDFLGRISFNSNKSIDDGKSLFSFFKIISRNRNTILILTTRENLLNNYKNSIESFHSQSYEKNKLVLELDNYSTLIRGKIFYNQLVNSEISKKTIEDIFISKFYLKIISHLNYNPRITEIIISERNWNNFNPVDLKDRFISALEDPNDIWQYTFNHQLSNLSRSLLLHMSIWSDSILVTDLQQIIDVFSDKKGPKYNLVCNPELFNASLKELLNTFIIFKKDDLGIIALEFKNPSIQDFLFNYLIKNENLLQDYISNPFYTNQLVSNVALMKDGEGKFLGSEKYYIYLSSMMVNNFDNIKYVMLYPKNIDDGDSFIWDNYPHAELGRIMLFYNEFLFNGKYMFDYRTLLIKKVQNYFDKFMHLYNPIDLIDFEKCYKIFQSYLTVDQYEIMNIIGTRIVLLFNFMYFFNLEEYFPEGYKQFMNDKIKFDRAFGTGLYVQYAKNKDSKSRNLTLFSLKLIQGKLNEKITIKYPFLLKDFSQEEINDGMKLEQQDNINGDEKYKTDKKEQIKIAENYFTNLFRVNS